MDISENDVIKFSDKSKNGPCHFRYVQKWTYKRAVVAEQSNSSNSDIDKIVHDSCGFETAWFIFGLKTERLRTIFNTR